MAKRVAVQLVADGNAFVATTEKTLGTMRQQFAAAGRAIDKEFKDAFAGGAREAERAVRASMAQIENLTKSANLSNGGLKFDKAALTAELTTAKQYLATQQQVAAALDRVAAEEGQAGAAARVRAEAQRLAIAATEEQVRGIQQEIALLDRLQSELGQTAAQQRRVAVVSGETRAGMQQLSFQVADIASGFASGIPPMQIFAQQSTQVVQAVQMMTSRTTGLIGFLGGPWGLVITAAGTVLGSLAMKLWDAQEAMQTLESSSDNLGQAQGILGKMFDLSTGKIINNTQALRDNIYAQMLAMQNKAITARQEAQEALAESGAGRTSSIDRVWIRARAYASGVPGAPQFAERQLAKREAGGRNYEALIKAVAAGMPLETAVGELDRSGLSQNQYVAIQQALIKANDSFTAGVAARDMQAGLGGTLPSRYLSPKTGGRDRKGPKGPDPAKVAEAMSNKLGEAYEKAIQLRGQFDEMPSDIDRANNALIDAQQLIAQAQKALADPKATEENRKKAQDVLRVATEAKKLAEAAPSKPFTDNLETMREQIDAQRLLIDGRTAEYYTMQDQLQLAKDLGAEHLSQIPTLLEKRKITAEDVAEHQRLLAIQRLQSYQLQRQQEEEQKLLNLVRDREDVARQTIYDLLDGRGINAFKTMIRSLGEIARREMTEQVFKAIFGDHFEKQKLKILGLDKVDESGRRMATAIDRTIDPILALGDAAQVAADRLNGAANDNGIGSAVAGIGSGAARFNSAAGVGGIVVTAQRSIQRDFAKTIENLLGPKLTKSLSTAMRGAAYGEAASGVLRSLGVKQSSMGSQLGGAAGYALGSLIPGMGPIGGLIGGALGGTIGGLFKKTKQGGATITSSGGVLGSTIFGNSSSAKAAAGGAADTVIGQINQIMAAVGGTFSGGGGVTIGQRHGDWRVNAGGTSLKIKKGAKEFDDDQAAAIAYATQLTLQRGVISGISAASSKILKSGQDLQQAIEKVSLIESIPKLLKARTNPVAAALDELNDKWDRTVAVLKEGGATAAQYAEAQKLYELERADLMKAANDNLKSFIDGLNFGPNSGLSLRDQSVNARAELQPYLDAIAKGDIAGIDRDKYLAAADSYMQISRALNGSGSGYFDTVDELRKATQSLLDQSVKDAQAAEARDPFAEQTAKSTQAAANILDDHTKLLQSINNRLMAMGAGGGGGFVGSGRNFVN